MKSWQKCLIGAGVGMFLYLAWAFFAALSAADAESARKAAEWDASPRNPINVCIARGGVPITSSWDGRLKECTVLPR